MLSYDALLDAVEDRAAFRRRRRLQPAGGPGDKLFPPTYPGEGNEPPRHVFERRRIDGAERVCVLVDSVQSQANRLEEALLRAAQEGAISLPRVVVDFSGADLPKKVRDISSLDAPHRVFDAILRDALLGATPFPKSPQGERLRAADERDASAVLELSPNALLFGVWNSTGQGGGLGAKFARAIVSEIIGVDVPVEEIADARTGEIRSRTAGRRSGSRIDPLGVLSSVEVYKSASGWDVSEAGAGKKAKKVKPSEINHGNIRPSVDALGVTCDYALQTAVVTLAGLRRLRFGGDARRDRAARAYLAALGLVALAEQDRGGYALRSRCDLVCDGPAPLELVGFDGAAETIELPLEGARKLHERAFDAAKGEGFTLDATPLRLTPQEKLARIVRASQDKALSDESGDAAEG
jgi:CRISPR-associated protein Csb1